MIALTNPPGIKTFSGLQTHTPNPPLGLAYVATALTEAGLARRAIDATGEALDAVSPYPDRDHFMAQGLTLDEIVRPCIAEMARRGTPYRGVLYAGLMIGESGPRLIEYNVRFGDPECQVLMLRLDSDFLPALIACAEGGLDKITLDWIPEPAITVVMAAEGYPGSHQKGTEIKGLADAAKVEGVEIFHAGTEARDGRIFATGGRVLNVSATGKTVREAQARAYEAIARIDWPGGFCRKDIGWRAIAREAGKPAS